MRSQAQALLAADFIETITLTGARMYILAVIEHTTRRVRVLGATAHPTTAWVAQAARNLVMDLEDAGCRVKYLIRDRDSKYPALFDAILADVGISVVRTGVQMPRMNAIMERWVRTCRRELLDRTLIHSQRHLLQALREFEAHYNTHRPHQGLANARPLARYPNRSPTHTGSPTSTSTDMTVSAASSTNTSTPPDLPGRHFQQLHGARSGCSRMIDRERGVDLTFHWEQIWEHGGVQDRSAHRPKRSSTDQGPDQVLYAERAGPDLFARTEEFLRGPQRGPPQWTKPGMAREALTGQDVARPRLGLLRV